MLILLSVMYTSKNAISDSIYGQLANDDLAEWSKAVALGAIPKGREFEPHSHQKTFGFADRCAIFFCAAARTRPFLHINLTPQTKKSGFVMMSIASRKRSNRCHSQNG